MLNSRPIANRIMELGDRWVIVQALRLHGALVRLRSLGAAKLTANRMRQDGHGGPSGVFASDLAEAFEDDLGAVQRVPLHVRAKIGIAGPSINLSTGSLEKLLKKSVAESLSAYVVELVGLQRNFYLQFTLAFVCWFDMIKINQSQGISPKMKITAKDFQCQEKQTLPRRLHYFLIYQIQPY